MIIHQLSQQVVRIITDNPDHAVGIVLILIGITVGILTGLRKATKGTTRKHV